MNGGIFSSSYGCDGNQENGVFVVSISTVVKGKILKFLKKEHYL